MEITEIEATYSRTIQLGDYEPVKIIETVTAQVHPDDDLSQVEDELHERARTRVEREINARISEG